MGAPVYNTNFVGQGTRIPKPVMANKQGGTWVDDVYSKYKHVEAQGKKIGEMGAGAYGAYTMMRDAYPYVRQGMQAAGMA